MAGGGLKIKGLKNCGMALGVCAISFNPPYILGAGGVDAAAGGGECGEAGGLRFSTRERG
jgi:hypothetical protein